MNKMNKKDKTTQLNIDIQSWSSSISSDSGTYCSMCAAMAGPYQSPARFPEARPNSTSRCRPKGAGGWSPNQHTSLRWALSSWDSQSSAVPRLSRRGLPESLRDPACVWESSTCRSSLVWWCVAGHVQPEQSTHKHTHRPGERLYA